jgi:acyl-coenzyme A thioesterase PaaI-like protein
MSRFLEAGLHFQQFVVGVFHEELAVHPKVLSESPPVILYCHFWRSPVTQPDSASLQDTYAANSICFGCGPANQNGLRIKSFPQNDTVVCTWTPEPKYQSFNGALNGGIVGALLDCHLNWTGAWSLMKRDGLDKPPCTVTTEYSVKFLRPTPSTSPVQIIARAVELKERSAVVEGQLLSNGELCATCRAVFVAVKPGHPAYHRW